MLSIGVTEAMTRAGFAARGLTYFTIGFLALRSGRTVGNEGALAQLNSGVGSALLLVMAVGFLGYGFWRLSEAAIDSEGHGDDAKGIAVRIGGAISGLVHLGLAILALRLGTGGAGSGGDSSQEGAATALSLPGGQWLLALIAVALLATGLFQLVKAVRGDFLRQLDPEAAGRPWVIWAGRGGYAARGVVFLLIGVFTLRAARESDAAEAGGVEAALSALPSGVFAAAALGFVLFGLFSLVEARYRRINDPKVLDRLRAHVA